ncbi:MAG: hypothetical protein FWD97_00830 [Defluviitaleaceae bacterium]|nr:hypothetical protein [Defluviitaleaceae bacterium]
MPTNNQPKRRPITTHPGRGGHCPPQTHRQHPQTPEASSKTNEKPSSFVLEAVAEKKDSSLPPKPNEL